VEQQRRALLGILKLVIYWIAEKGIRSGWDPTERGANHCLQSSPSTKRFLNNAVVLVVGHRIVNQS
jgi:hypothetical protein